MLTPTFWWSNNDWICIKNVGMLPMVVRGRRDVPGKPVEHFHGKQCPLLFSSGFTPLSLTYCDIEAAISSSYSFFVVNTICMIPVIQAPLGRIEYMPVACLTNPGLGPRPSYTCGATIKIFLCVPTASLNFILIDLPVLVVTAIRYR